MFRDILVLFCACVAMATDNFDNRNSSAFGILSKNCMSMVNPTICLKKNALVMLDKLSSIDSLTIGENVRIFRSNNNSVPVKRISNGILEIILPRSTDPRNDILNQKLEERLNSFFETRTFEVFVFKPDTKFDDQEETVDEEDQFIGRGKKGKHYKKKFKKHCLLTIIAAKILAFKAFIISGLLLFAKKALIISKVALLVTFVIALKKVLAAKVHKAASSFFSGGSLIDVGDYQQIGDFSNGWDSNLLKRTQYGT